MQLIKDVRHSVELSYRIFSYQFLSKCTNVLKAYQLTRFMFPALKISRTRIQPTALAQFLKNSAQGWIL